MSLVANELQQPEPRGRGIAFLSSFVFHVALLLVLACWAYTAGRPSEGLLFSAEMDRSASTTFELVDDFDGDLDFASVDEVLVTPQPPVSLDLDISKLLNPAATNSASSFSATSLTSFSSSSPAKELENGGRSRGASFFGTYAEGNTFVYVLDSSSSMSGDPWVYACNKLIDSINGLKYGQEFFVICFDAQTSLLYRVRPNQAKFLVASREESKRVRRWLGSRRLGPSTMPAEALMFALGLKPDAIFLLSDGELKDNSREMLLLANVGSAKTPIHTINLFSQQGRRTLKGIARENGGTFTPISRF